MDNHVSWLISCPVSDSNFKSHLSNASICDIEQVLKFIEGKHGVKVKEKTLLAALRRKRREQNETD